MSTDISRRKEEEQHLKDEGRLPPGQLLASRFPVLHYGPIPGFNPTTWDFKAWGEVEDPLRLTWEEFNQLPRTKIVIDIHCVTRWSIPDTSWEGVSMRTLIDICSLKLLPTARFVLQHAENNYTTNLPLEIVLNDNFLLTTHYNGIPLTPEHGFPLRGVVGAIPGRLDLKTPYLWKGAKRLRGLEFMSEDRMGFWEQVGYHNEADVWKDQRFINK